AVRLEADDDAHDDHGEQREQEEAEGDAEEGQLATDGAAASVFALGVGREDLSPALRQRHVVAEPFHDRSQTLLLPQSIFPLEAEGQAEEVDLCDVGSATLAVEVVEVREEAVAGRVELEELELERVRQPLRLSRPSRVVDDLVRERR